MSGIRAGSFFSCDCGAEIVYTRPCPDAAQTSIPLCACGCEFLPTTRTALNLDAPGIADPDRVEPSTKLSTP